MHAVARDAYFIAYWWRKSPSEWSPNNAILFEHPIDWLMRFNRDTPSMPVRLSWWILLEPTFASKSAQNGVQQASNDDTEPTSIASGEERETPPDMPLALP